MKSLDSIEKRIKDAEDALLTYPNWVRKNSYFQGGESMRESKLVTNSHNPEETSAALKVNSRSPKKHIKA